MDHQSSSSHWLCEHCDSPVDTRFILIYSTGSNLRSPKISLLSSVLANELRHGLETYEKSGGYNPEGPGLAMVMEDGLRRHTFAYSLERSKDKVSYTQVPQNPEAVFIGVNEEPSYMRMNYSHTVGNAHVFIHMDYSKSGIPTIQSVLALPKEKEALTVDEHGVNLIEEEEGVLTCKPCT